EWAPVNRFGTWRQGGPIEFCYPEARKAVAGYLARYVVDGGYDGIAFLTYAENYSVHYGDEFGFNGPVLAWFKRQPAVAVGRKCVAACRGSATKVSGFRTRGDLPAGMERIMFVNPEVESGFAWEHFVDWSDEDITVQPADALAKGDAFARRRLLTAALKGKQK